MTLIGVKRLQQAMFEVAASSNRAAGSGGGSGYQAIQLLGSAQPNNGAGTGTGSPIVVTGSTVTFPIGRPVNVLIIGSIPTGGTAANPASLSIQVDGSISGSSLQGGAAVQAPTTILSVALLGPGIHTAALAIAQSNTIAYSWGVGQFYVFQLGA